MPELKSPQGTVVSVDDQQGERLIRQGWERSDKPKRGRPKKEATEE